MDQMDLMDQMDDFSFYGNAEKSIWSIRSTRSIKCRCRKFQAGNQYELLSQTVDEAL